MTVTSRLVFPVMVLILTIVFIFAGCVDSEGMSDGQIEIMEEVSARWESVEDEMEWPVKVRETAGITVGPDGAWWSATGLLESWPNGYHQKMTMLANEMLDNPTLSKTWLEPWPQLGYLRKDGTRAVIITRWDENGDLSVTWYDWHTRGRCGEWLTAEANELEFTDVSIAPDAQPVRDWNAWWQDVKAIWYDEKIHGYFCK